MARCTFLGEPRVVAYSRLPSPHSFARHRGTVYPPFSHPLSTMPPNYENVSSSPSSSHRFKPSLACIAEEEPKLIAIRTVIVPGGTNNSTKPFEVEIPIYDLNIYEPEPPRPALPDSYKRLLAEMESFIHNQKNSQKYTEMADNLYRKVAIEQAENTRISKPNFTNRDWYWYSQQTKYFVDKPINAETEVGYCCEDKTERRMHFDDGTMTTTVDTVQVNDDVFDLNADF